MLLAGLYQGYELGVYAGITEMEKLYAEGPVITANGRPIDSSFMDIQYVDVPE